MTLYGRERECARLERLLGEGGALVVRGEPGIGKTALLRHALEASSGMRVVHATAAAWEAAVPYAGLELVLGPVAGDVSRLSSAELASALREAAPLLVVVDDADHLDEPSARVLALVARRLEAEPVAFLLAAADGFAGSGLEELRLAPLDDVSARRVLEDRELQPPLVREAILELAGGNPRALTELAPATAPAAVRLERLALAALAEARIDEARAHAENGLQLGESCHLHAILAWAHALAGRERDCREHARAAFRLASPRDTGFGWQLATIALGELELGAGRHEEALAHLADVWETAAAPFVRMLAAPSLVEAAVRVGRPELAEAVAAAYADLGPSEALVARCRALVDRSDACYERALALERGSASRFERARTQLLYGEALRRARRRREARAQLHAAHEMFEKLGAEAWARRAAGELRGSGASANRGDTSRFAELTSQERQVARLVAAGATNKEVAAQLFLSPRTIDFHLRNVFAKLGITSRMQLGWFDLGADGTGDSAGATLRRAA